MPAFLIHLQNNMLQLMEDDLVTKAGDAFKNEQIDAYVAGVFSLDHLEDKAREDLGGKIAVGCGWSGTERMEGKLLRYTFVVILAVPVDRDEGQRHNATTLLTLIRQGIAGGTIAGDRANRAWTFAGEGPRPDVSTDTVFYFAQRWQVDLPAHGN